MAKDELKKKLGKVEKENNKLWQDIKDRANQIEGKNDRIRRMRVKINELSGQHESLSNQIKYAQELNVEHKKKHEDRINKLENERDELLAKIRECKVIIDAFVCFAQALK